VLETTYLDKLDKDWYTSVIQSILVFPILLKRNLQEPLVQLCSHYYLRTLSHRYPSYFLIPHQASHIFSFFSRMLKTCFSVSNSEWYTRLEVQQDEIGMWNNLNLPTTNIIKRITRQRGWIRWMNGSRPTISNLSQTRFLLFALTWWCNLILNYSLKQVLYPTWGLVHYKAMYEISLYKIFGYFKSITSVKLLSFPRLSIPPYYMIYNDLVLEKEDGKY